jgi:hypothetical protein
MILYLNNHNYLIQTICKAYVMYTYIPLTLYPRRGSTCISDIPFLKHSDIHKFNTRNTNKLAIPNFRLHKTGNSFLDKCIDIVKLQYNKIPQNLTELPFHKLKRESLLFSYQAYRYLCNGWYKF